MRHARQVELLGRLADPAAAGAARRTAEGQVDCVNLLLPGAVERLQPDPERSTLDRPRADERVQSVRDYLRDGSIPLDRTGLAELLREAVVNQVAIDRPGDGGLETALAGSR